MSTDATNHARGAPGAPPPLLPVLVLSFVSSLGTAVVTTGIFFLTESAYGFTRTQNYWLALLQGVTYVVGAVFAGRLVQRLRRAGVPTRTTLGATLVLLGLSCALPLLAARASGDTGGSAWAVWAMMLVYSPLTGVHWPVVESYVSAGRSGAELRRAMGVWNVVWCSATAGAWWAMGPMVKDHPLELIAGLGGVHVLSLVILARLARDPAPHGDGHEPCPPVYQRLLAVFRWLLPMSYVVSSALAPALPRTMAELGVSAAWGTGIAATWQVARVFTFALLQRWQGWHGRWAMPVVGGVLLLAGFALAVLAPVVASGTSGVVLVVVGLAAFGGGMATIYTAAIYYAMAVGSAQVDAGGTHEALIGVGYSLGPGCGLAAAGLVAGGVAREEAFGPIMLGLVAAIALGVTGLVVRRVFRASRGGGG